MSCTGEAISLFKSKAASISSLTFKASFFLRLIRAVFTNIFRTQPSNEPIPEKLSSLVKRITNPSCKMSSARDLSPIYRMQTENILGARASYSSFWAFLSPFLHSEIKSLSSISEYDDANQVANVASNLLLASISANFVKKDEFVLFLYIIRSIRI